ncbi:hypothetical protein JCM19233_1947 [Vibrio astriarenae]|nr:hypothetical protein JCM19233_1947 [Vibrio sp. C7]
MNLNQNTPPHPRENCVMTIAQDAKTNRLPHNVGLSAVVNHAILNSEKILDRDGELEVRVGSCAIVCTSMPDECFNFYQV